MKTTLFFLFIINMLFAVGIYGQVQEADIWHGILVENNTGSSKLLKFGIDSIATDGIDIILGESDLPPFPPLGVFEVRFYLPINDYNGTLGSYNDYRQGFLPFTGQKEFRIVCQEGTGTEVKYSWDFPDNITGTLQDIVLGTIINVAMTGSGSFTNTQPGIFNKLKMVINYSNVSDITKESNFIPESIDLYQNYPNPFNPYTIVKFSINEYSEVKLSVYDILGNKVADLFDGYLYAGSYSTTFDASSLSSGIYFYTLNASGTSITKKMTLLK